MARNEDKCAESSSVQPSEWRSPIPDEDFRKTATQIKTEVDPMHDDDDPSGLWSSMRSKVWSQYQLWDILLDKALFSYVEEAKCSGPNDNCNKFLAVVNEMEKLLGEFKCFMDGCVQDVEKEPNIPQDKLGPELKRAYQIHIQSGHTLVLKSIKCINPLYQKFFTQKPNQAVTKEDFEPYISDDQRSLDGWTPDDEVSNNSIADTKRRPKIACAWMKRPGDGLLVCKFKDCPSTHGFSSVIDIRHHFQDNHAVPEDFIYPCNDCDESFVHLDLLQEHREEVHQAQVKSERKATNPKRPAFAKTEKASHICDRCGRGYTKPYHLERHLTKCDGIPEPTYRPMWQKTEEGRFICAVPGCTSDKSWTSSFSVWYHFNSDHADMQDDSYCVFKCDLCDEKFPTRSMLTRHRNQKHESLFRYQCPQCPKRLPTNKMLKVS